MRKIGAVLALAVLCMSIILSSPVRAAVTTDNTLSVSPTSVKWGESVTIRYNVSVNGGYIWWNGTATLYLIDPEGTNTSRGSSAINLGDTVSADWANWTYEPRMSGTWTIWVIQTKTDGNGTFDEVTNETTTFSMERQGTWLNRIVQDWTALWWFIFAALALMLVVIVVFNRTMGRDRTG